MSRTRQKMYQTLRKAKARMPGAKFTLAEEDAICDEYRTGGRTKEIADRLGVKRDVISDIFRRHKVKIRPHSLLPDQIERMRIGKTGKPQNPEDVARRCAATKRAIEARSGRMWRSVIKMYKAGVKLDIIATKHNIDLSNIHYIRKKFNVPRRTGLSSKPE